MSSGKSPDQTQWVYEVNDGYQVIRVIRHEVVPQRGSFEVRFPDGRPSRHFYWDDIPARRLHGHMMDSDSALDAALKLAKAERDKHKPRRP